MSDTKLEIHSVIQNLVNEAKTAVTTEELNFKKQVNRGLIDVREGRTLSHEEVKESLAK